MPTYVIRAGDTPFVKIGWANDPESRRNDLQCAHYEKLTIIRLIDGPPSTERWMHRRFLAWRHRREWFIFDPEMLTIDPTAFREPQEPETAEVIPFLNEDEVLDQVEAFLVSVGMSATAFGRAAMGDPTLVHEIRKGRECKRAARATISKFIHCFPRAKAAA